MRPAKWTAKLTDGSAALAGMRKDWQMSKQGESLEKLPLPSPACAVLVALSLLVEII